MAKRKDTPMVFTESGPTEWSEESVRAYKEGLRILARMIAADILKKRTASSATSANLNPSNEEKLKNSRGGNR